MEYILHLLIIFLIYGILALSLNLIVGYTGLLSIGQAAFFGIGSYSIAFFGKQLNFNFFNSLLAGMLIAAVLSLLIGLVFIKLKNDYYALATLSLNVIMVGIFINWTNVTGGVFGVSGIQRPIIFGLSLINNVHFLILAAPMFLLALILSWLIDKSAFGLALRAIRENEKAFEMFGFKIKHYKLAITAIGSVLASVAGSIYASFIMFIDPTSFTTNESIFILSIIILGGLGSWRGSLAGTAILVFLPELLRFIGLPYDIAAQSRQLIYGLALLLVILYRPKGLFGEYKIA